MGSAGSGSPDESFQERLARMEKRRAPIEAAKQPVDVLPDWKASLVKPVTLIGAVILGMIAVVFARYARFHLMGGTLAGDNPDVAMAIDLAVAFGVAAGVFAILRFEGFANKGAHLFGILVMIAMMHNMVHAAPGVFNLLFSSDWTENVVSASEPNSLYFRGDFIELAPEIEEEIEKPAKPKVRRLG